MGPGQAMKSGLICWDSAVLIYWIKKDQNRIKNIRPVVECVKSGQYNLIASSLTYVEILETAMPDGAIDAVENFMENRDMLKVMAVDVRIAKKAQAIRNISLKNGRKISTPDAVHLATAIVSQADFFHTFDKRLLSLNGAGEAEGVAITACHIPGTTYSVFDS